MHSLSFSVVTELFVEFNPSGQQAIETITFFFALMGARAGEAHLVVDLRHRTLRSSCCIEPLVVEACNLPTAECISSHIEGHPNGQQAIKTIAAFIAHYVIIVRITMGQWGSINSGVCSCYD